MTVPRVAGFDLQPPLITQGIKDFEKEATRTWIGDGKDADAEIFTARRSQLDVVAVVVMYSGLGQHGVVFDLAFTEM